MSVMSNAIVGKREEESDDDVAPIYLPTGILAGYVERPLIRSVNYDETDVLLEYIHLRKMLLHLDG